MDDLTNTLNEMKLAVKKSPVINLDNLDQGNYMAVCIDMNNGFAKEGALFSEYTAQMIDKIGGFLRKCNQEGIPCVGFTDCHTEDCLEFKSYPEHCLKNDEQSEFVAEYADINMEILPKNSTNGFFDFDVATCMDELRNVFVVGCCTDICIYQFAVTLKAYFNENNMALDVIVPINLVDTYDAPNHNREFWQTTALTSMAQNGVNVVYAIY